MLFRPVFETMKWGSKTIVRATMCGGRCASSCCGAIDQKDISEGIEAVTPEADEKTGEDIVDDVFGPFDFSGDDWDTFLGATTMFTVFVTMFTTTPLLYL